MRARSALTVAALLALALAWFAMPSPSDRLEGHAAASLQLELEVTGLLDRLLVTPSDTPAEGPAPGGGVGGPGDAGSSPVGGGSVAVQVHVLSGAHAWSVWVPADVETQVDLDGDRTAELAVTADDQTLPTLRVRGLHAAGTAWAVYVEPGKARWGLTGSDTPPGVVEVGYRGGDLVVTADGAAAPRWHVAFIVADQGRRALAWQSEPEGLQAFDAQVGASSYRVVVRDAGAGVSRLVVSQGEATHTLTLRDTRAGATILQDAARGFRYAAPLEGGGLAYDGDAAVMGQPGRANFASAFLPTNLTVAPRAQGFQVHADRPTDLSLDWQPAVGEGLRVAGHQVRDLDAQPGADGGLALRGDGAVRVLRPAAGLAVPPEARDAYVSLDGNQAVLVGQESSLAALSAVGVGVGLGAWAFRARGRATKAPASKDV